MTSFQSTCELHIATDSLSRCEVSQVPILGKRSRYGSFGAIEQVWVWQVLSKFLVKLFYLRWLNL